VVGGAVVGGAVVGGAVVGGVVVVVVGRSVVVVVGRSVVEVVRSTVVVVADRPASSRISDSWGSAIDPIRPSTKRVAVTGAAIRAHRGQPR
jgi:hypothetical protein